MSIIMSNMALNNFQLREMKVITNPGTEPFEDVTVITTITNSESMSTIGRFSNTQTIIAKTFQVIFCSASSAESIAF